MVASVRPGRLTPMPRSRSTENACGEVTSCTRWRSTYKTAGASSVSGRTRCASQSLPKSVRGADCATHHPGLGGRLALQASRGASVHHLQVGLGAGEDDVGAQAAPAIGAALVLDDDDHFTLRILAGADARDGEVAQTRFHAGDALDALEDGVDRTVAGGRLVELPPVAGEERHGGSGRRAGAADRVEARQLPAARRPVLEEADEQRVEVAVVDLLLLVREPLQLLEYLVDLLRLELVAEIVQPRVQRMAAAVLAEHEVAALEADVLGPHHLVRLLVVDHPVLVDAGFVGEGVLPDHRLVARDVESRRSRHHPARRAELLRTDARAQAEEVVARAQRHHHFLERTVPGALADPVDGALHLPRPRLERRQAVGYRHAEIVMAVDAEHHAVDAADLGAQVLDDGGEVRRHRVPDGVGDVDGRGARLDGALHHFDEEVRLRACRVLGGELHVVAALARVLDGAGGDADHFRLRHPQLVLAVDRARGEEDVDPTARRGRQRLEDGVDVRPVRARERADDGALHLPGDRFHGLEIAWRRDGKSDFHHVHAERRESLRHLHLLREVHAPAWGLLTVAQRGVEHDHPVARLVPVPVHPRRSCFWFESHAATPSSDSAASSCAPPPGPRCIATAPVRTSSRIPNGRNTSTSPSSFSCVPVVSTITDAGPRSTTRARKVCTSCSNSARRFCAARTFTNAISRVTDGAWVTSSTASTLTSL